MIYLRGAPMSAAETMDPREPIAHSVNVSMAIRVSKV